MIQDSWERRMQLMRASLGPMAPFMGHWEGQGEAHGEIIHSQLHVQPILDGTMLEVREQTGTHTDICYYRWEPDSGGYVVIHLMPGQVNEHAVEPTGNGFIWVTNPQNPAVEWRETLTGIRQEVVWPDSENPEVWIDYVRVTDAG